MSWDEAPRFRFCFYKGCMHAEQNVCVCVFVCVCACVCVCVCVCG